MTLYRLKNLLYLIRSEDGKASVAKRFEKDDIFLVVEKYHTKWKDHNTISFKLLNGVGIYSYYVFDMDEFHLKFEELKEESL